MTPPLYNPGLVGLEESVAGFVARADLLGRMIEELNADQPQHHLFIGQRGMGKTTLLRRIAAEVDRNPALASRWIGLSFPEEQYNVAHLSDLWLNCLDALADSLERGGAGAEAKGLDTFIRSLPREEEQRSALALDQLLGWTRSHRGLVLCIDNLQQVLGRLDKDGRWALRKVLGSRDRLVVFAASPALPAATSDYGEAFYDFFQAHWLRGLDLAETTLVLRSLAERNGLPEVAAALDRSPGRLRALHVLTGGNPRTVAHLFQVIARSPGADVREQLEALLDQCTPLYKARFEELANQAQIVLDAVALAWDPTTAGALAEHTRMDVSSVSTQLHRLHSEGLVDKVDIPGVTRQGFQVAERFFNLWYLMRASRRLRGRVLSLARCLETLYEVAELQSLGATILSAPGEADLALAVARALPDGGMRRALWGAALDQAPGDFGLGELLAQLAPGEEPVRDIAERKRRVNAALAATKGLDFEGVGIERELGEAGVAMAANISTPADPHVAPDPRDVGPPPSAGDYMAVSRNFAWLRDSFGPIAWRAVHDGLLNGDLASPALYELDRTDTEAVGIRHGCPYLTLFGDLLGGAPIDRDAILATRDAHLAVLASSRAIEPALRLELALRATEWRPDFVAAWERATMSALGNQFGSGAPMYAQRAVQLGSTDPICIALTLAHAPEIDALARRIEQSEHVNARPAAALAAFAVASREPDTAHRLWRKAASASAADLVPLLTILVNANHLDTAMLIAEESRDHALPVYAAMVAVHGRDAALLRRFAPEVAGPARDVLRTLWPAGLVEKLPPRKANRRRK